MILTFILTGIGLLGLAAVLALAYGTTSRAHDVNELGRQLRPLDLHAFRNLISPTEEEFLRAHLPPAQFRSVQRLRLRATAAYVSTAAHNAGVLIRLGTLAQASPEPSTVATAQVLVQDALRMRLLAAIVMLRIWICVALPSLRFSPAVVGDRYEGLVLRAGSLGHQWRRTTSALAS